MKRVFVLFTLLSFVFYLSACSKNNDTVPSDENGSTSPDIVSSENTTLKTTSGLMSLPEGTEEGIAAPVTAADYEGVINVEVSDARFINYLGNYYVVIKTKLKWTEEYAASDPYIKAYYSICVDNTNNQTFPCDRMLQNDYQSAGYSAFNSDFSLFEASYMKAGTESEGGFVGRVEAGCTDALLRLVVCEQTGDKVFCEVGIVKN